ncbi:unnamed protein product [Cylicostephanus goldi]|uniref:Uncharacterized protein n=1 Tax=Cylicostephanus goldi TaxID=71465 RepID=A0A3P7LX54_CYLGO|nr:unnamed protein product [Cylicostephanus goldi]
MDDEEEEREQEDELMLIDEEEVGEERTKIEYEEKKSTKWEGRFKYFLDDTCTMSLMNPTKCHVRLLVGHRIDTIPM